MNEKLFAVIFVIAVFLLLWWLLKRKPTIERKAIPAHIKREVLKRQNNACILCTETKFLQAHHKKKIEDGGDNSIENIVFLCPNHHMLAHAKKARVDYKR